MANGSSLLKTEDWLAVWLGFLILILVLAGVRPQLPSFRWATDSGFAASVLGLILTSQPLYQGDNSNNYQSPKKNHKNPSKRRKAKVHHKYGVSKLY